MAHYRPIIVLGLILALAVFFRFFLLTELPPGLYPDEAANGNNAMEAIRSGTFKIFYPENNGREGFFINIQALAIQALGAEPWVLRAVSAIAGTLTVLGIYLLARELFREQQSHGGNRISYGEYIALLAAFFLTTNYWHINFSRIGFRAILVPLLSTFGTYWLLKSLRTGKLSSTILGGISIGLGFHTYIAFRFVPFALAVPIISSLIQWRQQKLSKRAADPIRDPREDERAWYPTAFGRASPSGSAVPLAGQDKPVENGTAARPALHCIPCIITLFLFITFIVALPIGLYFLEHPQDFFGRGGQVSIFSADAPLTEFAKSTILTLGMFNVLGDCNQRHNLACKPELFWPVGIFFLIGLAKTITGVLRERRTMPDLLLIAWFVFLMLPATLTREGLPHALRAIGLIPPIMLFAGRGAAWLWVALEGYLDRSAANPAYERYRRQLARIKKELAVAALLLLVWIPIETYRSYFIRFAASPRTYSAFAVDLWHAGQYLDRLPNEVPKFVIVNLSGDDIRGVPAPAQTVLFATDTFDIENRAIKNIRYVTRLDDIAIDSRTETVIIPLNPRDEPLLRAIRERFPSLTARAPGDFLVFQN